MKLHVEFEFCASHVLSEVDSGCGRLHGHAYVLIVDLDGPVDPRTGMVADFDVIDALVNREIIDRVDHRHLNDFLEQPTAEVILVWFWRLLRPHLPITSLRLYETRRFSATYTGEPGVEVRYAPGYEGPCA